MNRRNMFRRLFGLAAVGAVGAASSVLLKAEGSNWTVTCAAPSGCYPNYVEPPPDTRSPEQVVEDQRKEDIKYRVRDITTDYPGRRRFALRGHDADELTGIAHELGNKNIPFEWRTFNGKLGLVVNGNVMLPR